MESDWGENGWAVEVGKAGRVETGGPHWLEVLVRGSEVGGALGAFVFHHAVISENPPHAHLDFMKIAFVLEGDYVFRVGDAMFSGSPGTLVVVPRGSQHTFTTETGGKVLFVCSPSGNEELFLEMAQLGPGATPADLAELNDRFGTVALPGEDGVSWRQMRP